MPFFQTKTYNKSRLMNDFFGHINLQYNAIELLNINNMNIKVF